VGYRSFFSVPQLSTSGETVLRTITPVELVKPALSKSDAVLAYLVLYFKLPLVPCITPALPVLCGTDPNSQPANHANQVVSFPVILHPCPFALAFPATMIFPTLPFLSHATPLHHPHLPYHLHSQSKIPTAQISAHHTSQTLMHSAIPNYRRAATVSRKQSRPI
jgi:hypothetical protein